jgi:putative ABC transport system substrate-binding protein
MAPVKEGIVASIGRPGGNVTGVQIIADSPKALEWLLKLAPGTKVVYVPYHPDDRVAVAARRALPAAAARLGVTLRLDAVHTLEAVLAAIENLPKDAGILFIPTPEFALHTGTMRQRAIARGIPTGAYALFGEDVLFTYGPKRYIQGQQAARLAAQILQGTKPADLLVETAELFLQINLQTAAAIGLDIPDKFLRQADTIVR